MKSENKLSGRLLVVEKSLRLATPIVALIGLTIWAISLAIIETQGKSSNSYAFLLLRNAGLVIFSLVSVLYVAVLFSSKKARECRVLTGEQIKLICWFLFLAMLAVLGLFQLNSLLTKSLSYVAVFAVIVDILFFINGKDELYKRLLDIALILITSFVVSLSFTG
ncbi:hypothetical protein VoSk93_00410 [Vibrio owensii]